MLRRLDQRDDNLTCLSETLLSTKVVSAMFFSSYGLGCRCLYELKNVFLGWATPVETRVSQCEGKPKLDGKPIKSIVIAIRVYFLP
ncbi:hypothetical protein SAY87_017451 [Trapa incisa]|uniref:Uncharacterized protein n=1 Tax=Trapa incisa TaxID=236973 RepID=A0AAN7L3T8_9MYRT|nr:hypothetical protein SAY87_017451 [Trapa incisa]